MSSFMAAAPFLAGTKRARTRDQLLVATQELLVSASAVALGIRQIATRAGLVHASFYNYYDSVESLIEDLANLVFVSHAAVVARGRENVIDPVAVFSMVTRQTLRLVTSSPGYGRLLFDVGLPVGPFLSGLGTLIQPDVTAGVAMGVFNADDVDIASSMIAGALLGVSLDLHRGVLPATAIEPATARMLEALGVAVDVARQAAVQETRFLAAPALPLRWQTVGV
jgi:AcrR family transcriptional regulator